MTLPKGARTLPVLPFSLRHGALRGFEREPGADEEEEKRDARERVRRASRPGGRRHGGPEPHRSNPAFGTIAILKGISVSRRDPFFRENGPSGLKVARVENSRSRHMMRAQI